MALPTAVPGLASRRQLLALIGGSLTASSSPEVLAPPLVRPASRDDLNRTGATAQSKRYSTSALSSWPSLEWGTCAAAVLLDTLVPAAPLPRKRAIELQGKLQQAELRPERARSWSEEETQCKQGKALRTIDQMMLSGAGSTDAYATTLFSTRCSFRC